METITQNTIENLKPDLGSHILNLSGKEIATYSKNLNFLESKEFSTYGFDSYDLALIREFMRVHYTTDIQTFIDFFQSYECDFDALMTVLLEFKDIDYQTGVNALNVLQEHFSFSFNQSKIVLRGLIYHDCNLDNIEENMYVIHNDSPFKDPFTNFAEYWKTELECLEYDSYYDYEKFGRDMSWDFTYVSFESEDIDKLPTLQDIFVYNQ